MLVRTVRDAATPGHNAATSGTAAVLAGPRHVTIGAADIPELQPDQVLIELEGCGLCGSNLPVWQGRPWFSYPLESGAPGHEGWGRIAALGPGVSRLRLGQRVAALSYRAFARFDVAAADAVAELPEELAGRPFPAEPLACALNVFRRSDVRPGQRVAIVGCGFLGCLLAGLANAAGAGVAAFSRRRFALEAAASQGAEQLIELPGGDLSSAVAQAGGEESFDCVIEATGIQEALDLASRLVRVRGRLVIAGYHQDGPRQINLQQWNWKGLDVINAHERDPRVYVEGMESAIDAVRRGVLRPDPLYTHAFQLDELARAFEHLEQRPEGFLKAVVYS